MATEHLVFLSVPGLRPCDIDETTTPTLHGWASGGTIAEMAPTFPCVTSPVQASMMTGTVSSDHGIISNGFYRRDRCEVDFWVAGNDVVAGTQIWDEIRATRPDFTSAVWHVQNIKGAGADYIVTPAPIHRADGTTEPWCYSKPDDLYRRMLDAVGHFPLHRYWGPLADIESTRWILNAASWLTDTYAPNFHWIYLPHLDYAAQRHGPNSAEAKTALVELDRVLGEFAARSADSPIAGDVVHLVAGEYALTDVTGALFPNRTLREAGLVAMRSEAGTEHIDLANSKAFAMVDHQLAHVFVKGSDPTTIDRCCRVLECTPGVAGVYAGNARERIGINHKRSGDLVLVSDDICWFAYYWWLDDAAAPRFARTIDIHRKPGYDPVELFFDPAAKGIPLDADLIKGSHGVPATRPEHRTALICSQASDAVRSGHTYRDTDIKQMCLNLLGLAATG